MELIAAHAAAAGLAAERVEDVLQCVSCDDALRILREADLCGQTMDRLMERIAFHLQAKAGVEIGAIAFSKVYGLLGQTAGADGLLRRIVLTGEDKI